MFDYDSPPDDPYERDYEIFDKEYEESPENFEPEVQEAMMVIAEGGTPERLEWAMEVYSKAVQAYKESLNDIDWEEYENDRQYEYYNR